MASESGKSDDYDGTCSFGRTGARCGGDHCLDCYLEAQGACQRFAASVASGKHDAEGFTPAERKAEQRRNGGTMIGRCWRRLIAGCWFGHGGQVWAKTATRFCLRCDLCGCETAGWVVERATLKPYADVRRVVRNLQLRKRA